MGRWSPADRRLGGREGDKTLYIQLCMRCVSKLDQGLTSSSNSSNSKKSVLGRERQRKRTVACQQEEERERV
jgi:hypothetical protein